MTEKMDNLFETKDKQLTPFLLTRPELQYHGTRLIGSSIYFLFSPPEVAQQLANDFVARKADPVQPKDLLDAVETYRDIVFGMKEKRRNYVPR